MKNFYRVTVYYKNGKRHVESFAMPETAMAAFRHYRFKADITPNNERDIRSIKLHHIGEREPYYSVRYYK